jgi:hypothetical protein
MSPLQASAGMTSRGRFLEVMRFGQPGRVPYFEEGIRDEVIHVWQEQGLSGKRELEKAFPWNMREKWSWIWTRILN